MRWRHRPNGWQLQRARCRRRRRTLVVAMTWCRDVDNVAGHAKHEIGDEARGATQNALRLESSQVVNATPGAPLPGGIGLERQLDDAGVGEERRRHRAFER